MGTRTKEARARTDVSPSSFPELIPEWDLWVTVDDASDTRGAWGVPGYRTSLCEEGLACGLSGWFDSILLLLITAACHRPRLPAVLCFFPFAHTWPLGEVVYG